MSTGGEMAVYVARVRPGDDLPPGEYLITISERTATLAYRVERRHTWGPPIEAAPG